MKFRFLTALFILIICTTMSVTAMAQPETTEVTTRRNAATGHDRKQLTDEQKAELEAMKARMRKSLEKWNALTDDQKNEIYKLKDQIFDIEGKIIDKYLSFGLIDQDTANNMKKNMSEAKTRMRENGRMPMFKMRTQNPRHCPPDKAKETPREIPSE